MNNTQNSVEDAPCCRISYCCIIMEIVCVTLVNHLFVCHDFWGFAGRRMRESLVGDWGVGWCVGVGVEGFSGAKRRMTSRHAHDALNKL